MVRRFLNWRPALALMALAAALVICCFVGCQNEDPSKVPDSTPAVGSSIDQSKSHVNSAEALVTRAKPESNKTGQALLDAASGEHGEAVKQLDIAKTELAKVSAERADLVKITDSLLGDLNKAKNTWGYKLGQFVNKIIWMIVGFFALHLLLSVGGFFIGGPVGLIMSKAASWTNVGKYLSMLSPDHWLSPGCPKCPGQ